MPIRFTNKSTFKTLPEGTYEFEIVSAKTGTSKKGEPQLQVTLEVADGDHAGTKHTEWMQATPAAGWRIDQLAEAAGVTKVDTGEQDENGDPLLELDEADLAGAFVSAVIVQREYEGKTFANAQKFTRSRLSTEASAPAPKAASKAAPTTAAAAASGEAPGAAPIAPRRPRPRPTETA